MFQAKVVEKIETHILCSVIFFHPKNRAFYEIMWKNVGEPDRPQVMHMCIACLITKARDTLLEY
jgi:hypothetical protein